MKTEELTGYMKRNCRNLDEYMSEIPSHDAAALTSAVLQTCNPRNAAARLSDLMQNVLPETISTVLAQPETCRMLLSVISGSRFLFGVMYRQPELLGRQFVQGNYLLRKTRALKETELRSKIADVGTTKDLDKILRLYKEEDYLRIGIRDLTEIADVREVMAELSDLAAACVQAALEFHWRRLVARHGIPPVVSGMGLAVIGMGKISGRELNFSSDVDLIFLREPEEGRTAGPDAVSVTKFYESLVKSVTQSLSDVTEDGFVFRIDLRLRPEGEKGELVPSTANALDYYLGWGRTWERAVLMKAAPIAGDIDLAKSFLSELEPFIYRKHLDYSTIEEMRVMKSRIESQLRRKPGLNIKLGQGGIREIEFFVQALQLINAGRTPRVRSSGTVEALSLLYESGLLDKKTAEELRTDYLFFRKIEHRIQINHQLQTHELPKSLEEQEELAFKLGYRVEALQRFLADLEKARKSVEDLFAGLFYQAGESGLQVISPDIKRLFDSIHDEAAAAAILAKMGFNDPVGSYKILKGIAVPSEKKITTEKGRQLLERLSPLFVEEILTVPEPGKALVYLDSYIDSLHAHSSYFSTLLENPPTIKFIVKILGESRFFTDLLVRHPQAIDSLIARGAEAYPKPRESLENILAERMAYSEEFEEKLDILRRFKNEEMLLTGVHHLMGEIDSPTARRLVTDLAEVCLSASVEIALDEMSRKFGEQEFFDSLPFVVLGMGKLGGMEMTYLSDLDVIFIYDSTFSTIGKLSSHEWFSRLASRIISILSVPTSEGVVWAIDTRLRPSGNKGPLVSSLDSFREYHGASSKLWEKQALIKSRPVTGTPRLMDEVTEIIKTRIMQTHLSPEDVSEIARLRKRMEDELALEDAGHVDLKTGHGGLVDVEFFVQANILRHAPNWPQVLCSNTLAALSSLRDCGLVDEHAFRVLDTGYRFLINLEDRLRIMEHRSIDRMPLEGDKLKGLARRLGYGDEGSRDLINDYQRVTSSIREVYGRFFASADGTTPKPL